MTKVVIYQPTKTAMQSGKANTLCWYLEYEQEATRFIEPVMHWTSNRSTKPQIRLTFPSKAEAIAYAERKGLVYHVYGPEQPKMVIKAYADNFKGKNG